MKTSKSDKTTAFIIEKVAPIFNKNGYVGTSLSDITKATGLTKGAVYGNFENKEHLAVEAFNFNIRKIVGLIAEKVNAETTALAKLKALTNFYRHYYEFTIEYGGCPLQNVGIDSNHQNPALKKRVNEIIEKLMNNIEFILLAGIANGEFKNDLDASMYAKRIFSIIEGGVFTTIMTENRNHLVDMMNFLDDLLDKELIE